MKFFLLLLILITTSCALIHSNPVYTSSQNSSYTVKKGDTLYRISQKFNISVSKIKKYNNLNSNIIIPGQKLYLTPQKDKTYYYVTKHKVPEKGYYIAKKGDDLRIISAKYGVPISDLLDYNNFASLNVKPKEKIWLKESKQVSNKKNKEKISDKKPISEPKTTKKKSKKKIKKHIGNLDLVLPLKGVVTSEFGLRHGRAHKGIDVAAPTGTPIKSVAKGKVAFVGIQNGYGNVIIIKHNENIMTVYAHNERNMVREGDIVKKGQPIATVGRTGRATGPHLHFEYRINGKAINPRKIFNF